MPKKSPTVGDRRVLVLHPGENLACWRGLGGREQNVKSWTSALCQLLQSRIYLVNTRVTRNNTRVYYTRAQVTYKFGAQAVCLGKPAVDNY